MEGKEDREEGRGKLGGEKKRSRRREERRDHQPQIMWRPGKEVDAEGCQKREGWGVAQTLALLCARFPRVEGGHRLVDDLGQSNGKKDGTKIELQCNTELNSDG